MPPKKHPKNAFFFYMLHYKQYEESKGRMFHGGMKEVADIAAPYWKNLSPEEKAPYEAKAREDRVKSKHHGERYTSLGVPLSQVQREKEEREAKKRKEKEIIDQLLETCAKEERLDTTNFFILSFNYFTKEVNGTYLPCELGIITFSIKNGLTMKFHSLINPGKLPLGHAFAAKDHSEKTHKLPPPPNAIGDGDYVSILTILTDFLIKNSKGYNDKFFPLIVLESEQEMVQNILTQFCDAAEVDVEQYVLLPITYFFEKLRNTCETHYSYNGTFPFSTAVASSHLERDIYQYHKGNGCPYHEKDEINIYCALSRATRMAYIILDQTMDICDVKKKKDGLHFPLDCSIDEKKMAVKKEEPSDDEGSDHSDKESKYSIPGSSVLSNRHHMLKGRINDEFDDSKSFLSSATSGRWRSKEDTLKEYKHRDRRSSRDDERYIRKKIAKHRSRRHSSSSSSSGSTPERKIKIKPDPDASDDDHYTSSYSLKRRH